MILQLFSSLIKLFMLCAHVLSLSAIVRPIISYGCPIFNNSAKTHRNKLATFENQVLRSAMNVKWDDFVSNAKLHQMAKCPPLEDFCTKLTNSFYSRCEDHKNPLISVIGNYQSTSLNFRLKHRLPKKL